MWKKHESHLKQSGLANLLVFPMADQVMANSGWESTCSLNIVPQPSRLRFNTKYTGGGIGRKNKTTLKIGYLFCPMLNKKIG